MYIPTIGQPIQLQKIGGPIVGIYKSLTVGNCGNWGWGRTVSLLGVYKLDFLCSTMSF